MYRDAIKCSRPAFLAFFGFMHVDDELYRMSRHFSMKQPGFQPGQFRHVAPLAPDQFMLKMGYAGEWSA